MHHRKMFAVCVLISLCTQLQHTDENTFADVADSPKFWRFIEYSGTRRLVQVYMYICILYTYCFF